MSNSKKGTRYEEVAKELLQKFRSHFGFDDVEGKQSVPGKAKKKWEIDAKALINGGERFAIIECRNHARDGISAEAMGAIAYRVNDTGAITALTVGPKPVQSGAKEIADQEGFEHVILDSDSTTEDYLMTFLNRTFMGVTEVANVVVTEKIEITVRDNSGNIVSSYLQDGTLDGKRSKK